MKWNYLRNVLRFVTALLAFSLSIYAILFNVMQALGTSDPSYAPDRITAFIYLIVIPLVATMPAWYFSFRKPLTGTSLALILLVSPLYLYITFQYTEDYQNQNFYNNSSINAQNKLSASEAQLVSLQSRVAELSNKVELLSSRLNSLDFTYTESTLDSNMSSTDITVNGKAVALPTLQFTPRGTHQGKEYLQVIDFAQVGDMTEIVPQLFLPMGLSEHPSDLRSVTIDGEKHSFSSYQFFEGFPIDDNCFAGGGIVSDLVTLKDRNLAFVITRTYSEKGCEGEPTEKSYTLSPNEVEEMLKIIESVKF